MKLDLPRKSPMLIALAILSASWSGCVVRKEQPIAFTRAREPIAVEAVKLYVDPPERYEVVSRIQSTAIAILEAPAQARARAREDLIRQAAAIGANGIVVEPGLAQANSDDALSATEVEGLAIFVPAP